MIINALTSNQLMELNFWFRPRRVKQKVPSRLQEGRITLTIKMGKTKLGPLSTSIVCYKKDWTPGRHCYIQSSINPVNNENPSEQLNEMRTLLFKARDYVKLLDPPVTPYKVWQTYLKIAQTGGVLEEDKSKYVSFIARWEEFNQTQEELRKQGFVSLGTVKNYKKYLTRYKLYAAFIGIQEATPSQITKTTIINYREWQFKQKKKDGSAYDLDYISKCCEYVKTLMNYCVDKRYADPTDYKSVKLSWKRVGKVYVVSEGDISRLIDLREKSKDVSRLYFEVITAFLFAQEVCMHWTDYFSLRPENFYDLDTAEPYVEKSRGKTDVSQTVFLTPFAIQLLEECGGPSGLPKLGGTYASGYKNACTVLKEIRENYGIEKLSFSLGRKTYLTRMHNERNASPLSIMKTAGWTSFKASKHYISVDKETLKRQQMTLREY